MKYNKWSFITVPNKQVLKGKDSLLQCVYMRVCSFADEEGICFPSYQTIADHAGCSKSTVTKKIKILIGLWLLAKTNRFKNNEQQSNLYQLLLQGIPSDTTPIPSDTMGGIPSDGHRTKSTSLTKSTELLGHPKELESSLVLEDEKVQFPLFVSHWTETFQRGKNKWKEKRKWEMTRDLKKRFATWMRNARTNFWRNIPKEPQTEQEFIALLNKIWTKAFTDKYWVDKHRETKLASL